MPLKHHFDCRLPHGVHARPASLLEEMARKFASELTLFNERTGRSANGKSVLSIISADIRCDDRCMLTVSGEDEHEALAAMTAFLDETFPHCDDALPPLKLSDQSHLPPGLLNSGVKIFSGVPVVAGVAQGRLLQVGGFKIPAGLKLYGVMDAQAEERTLDEALQRLEGFYDRRLTTAKKGIETGLIKAHRAIARDLEFRRLLVEAVKQRQRTAAGAIVDAEAYFSAMLAQSDNALLRERVLDVQDVCLQLLRQVYGDAVFGTVDPQLNRDTIVVAEMLTPSQFLALNRDFLKGMVLGQAGGTSHTVILARSFGIPTLTDVKDLAGARLENAEAIVDANAGVLMTNLNDVARRYYTLEFQRMADRQARVRQFAMKPAATKDGHRIEIGVNIASVDEVARAFDFGAEGIGLFRTEMLFFDRDSAPGEQEQFDIYGPVMFLAGDRPVIFRTLDVGGDKSLDYLNLPAEENPFLGYRAVRLYPGFETLFRNQLRALIRASALGRMKLMIPMIATLDEVRWVRQVIAEEQAKCQAENVAYDAAMPVGAMIEVPATAFAMEDLCRELDFFSIGSNDLLQYFMAADRANARVTGLYNPLHPMFLRLLKQIVSQAHAYGKWIGLCGEMGGQVQLLPLLAGLGLDEISVTAPAIANLKAELASLTLPQCEALLEQAIKCSTAGDVTKLLGDFTINHELPLIDADLILVDADAQTKEEAIKLAVNQLDVLGRTKDLHAVENAVWQREKTYSTGFGHGFAIPHCKTNAVQSNSLVLVKLRNPVAWDSLDGKPVELVILLAMREAESATGHLKVFARLARQVMNDEFRTRLVEENDAGKLCALLRGNLEV